MSSGSLKAFGDAVHLGPRATTVASLATAGFFAPVYGVVPQILSGLAVAYGYSPTPASVISGGVALGLAPFLAGRMSQHMAARVKKPKDRYRGLKIGPVKATERDLMTSMLILGATGSGKTSRILLPALEDIINTYCDEDPEVFSKNPYQKCGGFILEVKGKFFETLVYLAHKAGRNACTDVRVIRANSTLPVVEFRDENGRRFYLNGQPFSTGSEVSILYKPHKFKDGSAIESTLFKRIRALDLHPREAELKEIAVKVHPDVRFIGWRWKSGKLHRVSRCLKRDNPEYTGEVIDPPTTLAYHRTLYLSNGLRYNLIDPKVPSSEAAGRIAMVAKMVTGEGKGGGDNAFFYQAAGKAIDSAIRLFRIINPKTEVTVLDVNRIIAHDSVMQASLNKLKDMITSMQQKKIAAEKAHDQDTAYELTKVISSYDDLSKWFTEEWMKLKSQGNTGTSIISTISNLFGPFMRDPSLQETFCQVSTFSFDDCMQKGTLFAFVPGSEYEMNMRLIGTTLKMDWQSRMLQRVSEGSDALNKNRIMLQVADECQSFIVSGSQDAGDPKFMSLSRESKVMNICATQSEAWVYSAISSNEARVWLQSFRTRVWLTQTDGKTNDAAAELCGKIKKETRTHTEELDLGNMVSGKGGTAKQKIGYEEKPRFQSHEFAELKEDEAICFNNGEGMLDMHMGDCKALKGKVPWRWITSDKGVAAIADRIRWWACETWENDIYESGRTGLLDPVGAPFVVTPPVAVAPLPLAPQPPVDSAGSVPPSPPPATSPPPSTPPSSGGGGPTPSTAVVDEPQHKASPLRAVDTDKPLTPGLNFRERPIVLAGPSNGPSPVPAQAQQSTPTIHAAPAVPVANQAPVENAAESLTVNTAEAAALPAEEGVQVVTPAMIAKQETAYKELLENNPFLMVSYEDFAGLDRSRLAARQKTAIPVEETALTGSTGVVGGNENILKKAANTEGPKADVFRAPLDLLAADPLVEMARRTVSGISGTSPAPDSVKSAHAQKATWGTLF